MLDERISRVNKLLSEDQICNREELARFVWSTAKAARKLISPEKGGARTEAWGNARGMLKELIDFNKFTPARFDDESVNFVLEKKVAQILERYRNFVLTGEVSTKHPPPKLLGETDLILCVDKPCRYTCSYGGRDYEVPQRAGAESCSVLLNGDKAEIQIHEYMALKYNFETALETRAWWKTGEEKKTCICGSCGYCACTQAGCCNRLDKETSGVMIAAKTKLAFKEVRNQFKSEHSIEKGGTEKYYIALVHGTVALPGWEEVKSQHWKHHTEAGRGRIEITMTIGRGKSSAYDDGSVKEAQEDTKAKGKGKGKEWDGDAEPQWAVTYYEPLAFFNSEERNEAYTLMLLQIITGRQHQIRFHCAQIGHSLVGDTVYGAPASDRVWAARVFLHSYQTRFREPFTERWFEATSPLPQDLGQLLEGLSLEKPQSGEEPRVLFSRRDHPTLHQCLKQYDPAKPLLVTHDVPVALTGAEGSSWQPHREVAWQVPAKCRGSPPVAKAAPVAIVSPMLAPLAAPSARGDITAVSPLLAPKAAPGVSPVLAPKAEPAARGDASDDEWGGWTASGADAQGLIDTAPPERVLLPLAGEIPGEVCSELAPPLKRPRVGLEVPATNANLLPTTPPRSVPVQASIAGGWLRKESRSCPGVYYYWNSFTNATSAEPPPPWEKKGSRSQPGVFYYWHPLTGATSAQKPEV
uniref:Pseudouridine synthase RsuA/RluA-like domain-containing protein n=1 Tax=Noctiluca scintillans TaxID=2966 RepID=A0A7S1FCR8_NOCSC